MRADDPRGLDLLHLRRDRRPRRQDERPLRRGHALSLAARAPDQRRPPAAALVREGRVLLRRLLPAQPGRARAPAGHALDRARALRRRGHAGSPDPPQRERRAARRSSSSSRSAPTSRTSSPSRSTTSRSGIPRRRGRCRRRRRPASTPTANQLVLEEATNGGAKTQVLFSQPGRIDGRRVVLPARARAARALGAARRRRPVARRARRLTGARSSAASATSAATSASRSTTWQLRVPQLRVESDDLRQAFVQSVADLAALRMRTRRRRSASCPRPGCPGS